ncbi:MAG: hypothetical protein JSV53_03035 [candidate division WOR-3 bacterium]|nr:MAG: hypothetical protein JSV53_03035 [candidate division WOR-3 bacterium]
MNTTRLLFGAFGTGALRYRKLLADAGFHCRQVSRHFITYNKNNSGGAVATAFSAHNKDLLLNGIFMLKDYTLDDVIDRGYGVLRSLLERRALTIPGHFVNGAYVGVIHEKNVLHIFSDFMALMPLYYVMYDGTLLFSTSLRLSSRLMKFSWDHSVINEFVHLGMNLSSKTIISGISCLPPASVLTCQNGEINVRTYASFPECGDLRYQQEDIVDEIHAEFNRAIERIHSARLKYSLSLTGGMDSRMIFLAWPDKSALMTETAGSDTSDYLKARELVSNYGNARLHELENKHEEKYTDGIIKYYELCDNPTKLATHYNYYHLKWKQDRGADIHLTGVGGELLDGESLYLSRKYSYVLREGFLPYAYHPLSQQMKPHLINSVLYAGYKKEIADMLDPGMVGRRIDFAQDIAARLNDFLGHPTYAETYVERFRTYVLANAAFYPLSFIGIGDFHVFPFNDSVLVRKISKYHPRTRELRRLSFKILRNYRFAQDIPVDTTHLKVFHPYHMQKAFRMLRMVLNIGFHKKVPVIQYGNPPSFRRPKYFDRKMADYREYVRSSILGCSFYDTNRVRNYIEKVEALSKTTFFTMHKEAVNIGLLLRLALAEQKFR